MPKKLGYGKDGMNATSLSKIVETNGNLYIIMVIMSEEQNIQFRIIESDTNSNVEIPVAGSNVSAGFPSPADDYLEQPLDLNKYLIRNPSSTFFVRVAGESMKDAGTKDGDLLIVDKSVEVYDECIAVSVIDGEFTLKRVRFEKTGSSCCLRMRSTSLSR